MKQFAKRTISIVTVCMLLVVMCLTSVSAAPTTATGYTKASDVDYKTYTISGGSHTYAVTKGIKNWGARGEECVFLSKYAVAYYTGNNTYDKLSKLDGGLSQTTAPGTALYNSLHTLMDVNFNHNYDKTRNMYQYTDCVSSDNSKLLLFYSSKFVGGAWVSGGTTFNREHLWPQSKGCNKSTPAGADMMILRPADPGGNTSRGNKAFGESSSYYKPTDDVKGDIARSLLYAYVRWEKTSTMWGTSGVIENLTVLLKWMQEDPVDTWEMGRNDAVQSITGNRNVFIDYPELAWLLFGRTVPSNMTTPSGEAKSGNDNQGGNSQGGGNQDNNDNTSSSTQGGSQDNNDKNDNSTPSGGSDRVDEDDRPTQSGNNTSSEDSAQGGIDKKPQNEGKPFDPNNLGGQYIQVDGDDGGMDTWVLVAIIAGSVVAVAAIAVVTVIVIKKKKAK